MFRLLHATNPGSALGGRTNPELSENRVPAKKVQKSKVAEVEDSKISTKYQDEPVFGHVYIKQNQTDVSSIGYFEGDILLNGWETLHETKEEGENVRSGLRVQADRHDSVGLVEVPNGGTKSRTAATAQVRSKLAKLNSTCSTKVQSNVTSNLTTQFFASDAANNYYQVMELNASKRNSFIKQSKRDAMDGTNEFRVVTGSDEAKVETSCDKSKEIIAIKKDGTKKQDKKAEKKTLEHLVADALSVVRSPAELAHHSLSHEDEEHNGSYEKESLSTHILTEHEELSIKTEIVPSSVVLPSVACPPVTSFDMFEMHRAVSTFSAATSITHQSDRHENPVTTETASSQENNVGEKSSNPGSYDPPMAEYHPPVCSQREDNLGYLEPDDEFSEVDFSGKLMLDILALNADEKNWERPGGEDNYLGCPEPDDEFRTVDFPGNPMLDDSALSSDEKIVEFGIEESIEEVLEAYQTKSTDSTACAGNLQELLMTSGMPPLADPISQARRVNDVLSGVGSTPVLGKKLNLARSMSTALLNKKKLESVDEDEVKSSIEGNPDPTSSSTRKSVIRSVRSMSPSFFLSSDKTGMKSTSKSLSDGSTTASSSGSSSSGTKTILIPHSSAGYDANQEDTMVIPVKIPTVMANKINSNFNSIVTSRKDTIISTETPTDAPAMDKDSRGCINTSAIEKTAAAKISKHIKSKSKALPPRIPSREVPSEIPQQHQMQQISTTLTYDGSVECSVMKDDNKEILQLNDDGSQKCSVMKDDNYEMLQLTVDGRVAVTSLSDGRNCAETTMVENTLLKCPSAKYGRGGISGFINADVKSKALMVAPVEEKKSRDDDVSIEALEKSTVAKKKSRMEMAKERSAKYQPRSPVRNEVKDDPELAAPIAEDANNATILSSTDSQKKKERLKKIMDYRKVAAHPTQKSKQGTVLENSKNIKEIEIRATEFASLGKEGAKKGPRKNVQQVGSTVEEKWHAPVRRIDVDPNALEHDADMDVSLPPELENGFKMIWQEDASLASVVRNGKDTKMFSDACMPCGEINRIDTDVFDGINPDNNKNLDVTDTDDDESTIGDGMEGGGRFSCGIEARQMRDDFILDARDLARDIQFGLGKGLRKLFGQCDITRDGGVDFLREMVDITSDQLNGRTSTETRRPPMTASNTKKSKPTRRKNEGETGDKARSAIDKQKRYIAKLKELTLKHA
jgi:hypothetical protein